MENLGIQVLDRALDLMEQLSTSESGLSITELSSRTGLAKSTVHRILGTYCARHYVEKDPTTSIYTLGYKFVEIASVYLNKIVLKTEAVPIMHDLATTFSCTSYLGVLENAEVMYLERVEQFNSLRLYTQIGKREPLHCTALGKVLLSGLREDEFESIARSLDYARYTPNTKTTYEELVQDVMFARTNGYAIDRGEHTVGGSCLAVPIYDYTRTIMAAMSVSGQGLLESYSIASIVEKLRQASMELSQRMGYTLTK